MPIESGFCLCPCLHGHFQETGGEPDVSLSTQAADPNSLVPPWVEGRISWKRPLWFAHGANWLLWPRPGLVLPWWPGSIPPYENVEAPCRHDGACEPSPFSHHQGVFLHLKLHFCVFEVKAFFFPKLDSCKLPSPCAWTWTPRMRTRPANDQAQVQGSSLGCPLRVQREDGASLSASLSSHLGDL